MYADTITLEYPVVLFDLAVSVDGSGSTSPSVGVYQYEEGTGVDVNATGSSGWSFDHWLLDSVDVGSSNPYEVTMDHDHTLTAVFTEIPLQDQVDDVIPEFPSWIILPLFLTATLFALILKKKIFHEG